MCVCVWGGGGSTLLGGLFDLVGLVRWVMGGYNRASRGYSVDLLSQKGLQVNPKPQTPESQARNSRSPKKALGFRDAGTDDRQCPA